MRFEQIKVWIDHLNCSKDVLLKCLKIAFKLLDFVVKADFRILSLKQRIFSQVTTEQRFKPYSQSYFL